MLILNLKRVFALRGIDNPFTYLVKNGFVRTTASNLLNGKTAFIRIEHLEAICEMLNCQPNDPFEWKPTSSVSTERHPLKMLRRAKNSRKFTDMVKTIPLDKLNQIESLLEEIRRDA